jgi:hypothetical protein
VSRLIKRKDGVFSQTILMVAIIGTDRTMPVIPHNQPQNRRESTTSKGLKFNRKIKVRNK